MKKRGQLSTFIITGLIILIVAGLGIYLVTKVLEPSYGVPDELVPMMNYIDQCTKDVALDGVFLAEMQGGYIHIPSKIESNPNAYLDRGFSIPYWFYNGYDRAPSIPELEAELSIYINTNLNDCLNNLDSFRNEWDITDIDEISTIVEIGDERILVNALISVEVNSLDGSIYMNLPSVESTIEVQLGNMLELAYAIHFKELTDYFLEFYTDEIIASSHYLPYDGIEFTCEPKVLDIENDIRPHIEGILMHNLHYLMFEETDYEETGYPYYDNIFKVDLGIKNMQDFKVTTTFDPSWGMELQVLPSKDGQVRSLDLLDQILILPCTKIYHHKYSTDFPILFTITDTKNPTHQFNFVLPVNMRRNLPNKFAEVPAWETEIDTFKSREYCAEETLVTVYETDIDGNMYTYEEMQANLRFSLSIFAEDSVYGPDATLANVNIKYRCVDMECNIGNTTYPRTDSGMYTGLSPHLEAKFPVCSNGILIAETPGYLKAIKIVTVDETTDQSVIQIPMVREKQMDFNVMVMQDHNNLLTERELFPGETAVITLANEELDYDQILVYENTANYTAFENLTLPVGDYTYTLKLQLIEDDNMIGGFEANWTIDLNDVLVNDKVTFYTLKKDLLYATTIPTQDDYTTIYDYVKENSEKYMPVVS